MWVVATALAAESVSVGDATITVDGHLDEAAWSTVEPATDFLRFQPTAGGEAPGRTEVRFLQDEKNLYVGIRVSEAGYRMRARISPREAINADDQIGVYLDTFDDGISGYIFYFNPLGVQQDIRHNAGNWNVSWDTLLKSRGRVVDDGFELEIAFPWRSLKFPNTRGEPQTWGVVLTRKVPHEGAKYSWPQLEVGTPRVFETANRLESVKPPKRGSGIEIQPSFTAGETWPVVPGPLWDNLRPSLDVRFGITPDVGLTGTLNPDFSQVESDVSDVRVNARFAYQFPEQRPFFLDGVDWFQDRGAALYTRTINQPLYGLKLGGREGPVSVGVMHALDRSPLPSFTEGGTPGFSADDVDGHLASNTLIRTRMDAFGVGYAGVVLADKRLVGTDSSHQLVGADFEVPLGDRWFAGGSWQHSFTGTADDRIWGSEQQLNVWRASGVGTGFGVDFLHRSPGFRKELGFLTQADQTYADAWVDHTFVPNGPLSIFRPRASATYRLEGNGDRYLNLNAGQRVVLLGIHGLTTNAWLQEFREEGVTLPGGGALLSYNSNFGRAVDVEAEAVGGRVIDYGLLLPALTAELSSTLTLRPTPGLRTDTTLRWNALRTADQPTTTASLIRNRTTLQLTRELGTRWVLDYSTRSDRDPRLFNSLLLTWLRNPGTAVWLGGSAVWVPKQGFTEGTLFAKISILFRP